MWRTHYGHGINAFVKWISACAVKYLTINGYVEPHQPQPEQERLVQAQLLRCIWNRQLFTRGQLFSTSLSYK